MGKYPVFMTERFDNVKIAILSKLIYKFNTIPIRIPADFFVETDKKVIKFI